MSEHKIPIPSMLYNAAVGGHVTNSQQIIDENLNREQNDINQETVGAVPYNSTTPNGMGRIVLKKNDNFKQIIEAQTDGNTIFVIKYDFTLTDNVTIPSNCVLKFDGGSISGTYTITGNNTSIEAGLVKIFDTDLILSGTWVSEGNIRWFGANPSSNDNTYSIQKCLDSFYTVKIDEYSYKTGHLIMSKTRNLIGENLWRDGTCLIFDIADNSTAITLTIEHNPYMVIKGIRFTTLSKGTGKICFDTTETIGEGGPTMKFEDVEINNFYTAILSNSNSFYNHFFRCRFNGIDICLKKFSSNNLTVDSCSVSECKSFLEFASTNNGGATRIINSVFEVIEDSVIKGTMSGPLIFMGNHCENYSGYIVFGTFLDIIEIGNLYYVAGTIDRIFYLYDPVNIYSVGNKISSDCSLEHHYVLYKSGETQTLKSIRYYNNNISFANDTYKNAFVCSVTWNGIRGTVVDGYDAKDMGLKIGDNSDVRDIGPTSDRPTYGYYTRLRTYYDTDLKKMLYCYQGVWRDAAGNQA